MSHEAVCVDPDRDYLTPGVLDLEQMFWTGLGAMYTHCNQVWPNLYIGDKKTALEKPGLVEMGVTHIINAAEGTWNNVSTVGAVKNDLLSYGHDMSPDPYTTGADYYRDMNIIYCGIEADDTPTFNISSYFYSAANFIHQALSDPDNKVLVHCMMGRSRSVTLVLAYMMIKQGLTLVDAIGHVRQRRCVLPNRGFLTQLRDLDIKLQEDKLRNRQTF